MITTFPHQCSAEGAVLSTIQRYRTANFALERTFRFTPLGLAFCFFMFVIHIHASQKIETKLGSVIKVITRK